jgi:thymidylate kinase
LFFGQITRILVAMNWDPVSTLRNALWITGGQWAGKSTVAGILAERYGLTHYHYDYHTTRGHEDRQIAAQIRNGQPPTERDGEAMWIRPTPREMADAALKDFADRFAWVLDDLRGLVTPVPVIADGWGLRPDLVVSVTAAPERMVVLVPTDEFRQRQAAHVPRAARVSAEVSDPELAQRNRIERDRLLAEDCVRTARERGVRVIEVDGSRDAEAVADVLADHFGSFLPRLMATSG